MGNADFELERIANAAERIADSLERLEKHFIPKPDFNPPGAALPRSVKADRRPTW